MLLSAGSQVGTSVSLELSDVNFKENSDVSEQMEKLEDTFQSLFHRLIKELEQEEAVCLIERLSRLPITLKSEYQSDILKIMPALQRMKRTSEVFLILGNLMSFVDPALLKYIVSVFGSIDLKKDFEEYDSNLQQFKQRTTVHQLQSCWPGQQSTSLEFEVLKSKFEITPDQYTLEMLDQLRRRYCSEVKLSDAVSNIVGESASVKFVEQIPSEASDMHTTNQGM